MKKLRFFALLISILFLASVAFGATYTDFISGNNTLSKSAYDPGKGKHVAFYQNRYIQMNSTAFSGYNSGVTNGDVIRCLEIPPQTIITEVGIYVVTGPVASASGVSATLGDGADPNGYATEFDFTAGGSTVWYTRGSLTNLSAPKAGAYLNKSGVSIYEGSDTIDVVMQMDKASTSGCTPAFYIWARGFHRPNQ